MEIRLLKKGDHFWTETIDFADKCSWRAGPYLADRMRKNFFQAEERVLAAIEDNKIIGYCTFALKDELPEEYEYSPFVGFVFVGEANRGNHLSEKMIMAASEYAKSLGYSRIYILSGECGLYEKYGFEKLGDFKTIYGTTDQLFQKFLK